MGPAKPRACATSFEVADTWRIERTVVKNLAGEEERQAHLGEGLHLSVGALAIGLMATYHQR